MSNSRLDVRESSVIAPFITIEQVRIVLVVELEISTPSSVLAQRIAM